MKVKKLNSKAKLPTRADSGSNGYDLYSTEDVFIPVGETKIIPTGIALDLVKPENPLLMQYFKIEDRSSMAAKGLRTGAGIIDNSYKGEIKIVIHNLNNTSTSHERGLGHLLSIRGYQINKGDKIAQGILTWSITEDVEEVQELTDTQRGSNGFGSSGV